MFFFFFFFKFVRNITQHFTLSKCQRPCTLNHPTNRQTITLRARNAEEKTRGAILSEIDKRRGEKMIEHSISLLKYRANRFTSEQLHKLSCSSSLKEPWPKKRIVQETFRQKAREKGIDAFVQNAQPSKIAVLDLELEGKTRLTPRKFIQRSIRFAFPSKSILILAWTFLLPLEEYLFDWTKN